MDSSGHKLKVLLGVGGWKCILFVIFPKLSFVNINSVPLAAVQKEVHLGEKKMGLSLLLHSDCFPIKPKKKINCCSKCLCRQENALWGLLVNMSMWWGGKKINTFFFKRATARGESSLSLSDWWNCIKVSYSPLSYIFILVTFQPAGVQCSASISITIQAKVEGTWET